MLKSNSFETISGFGRLQMKSCDYFFYSGLVSRSFGLLTEAKFMFGTRLQWVIMERKMCFYFMARCSFKQLDIYQPLCSSVVKPYDKFSTIINFPIFWRMKLQDGDDNDVTGASRNLQDLLTKVALI